MVKIKRIALQNFQGIKSLEIVPDGRDLCVYGANGTGKTTLYNAFCWLLFGRPSTTEKNFTPQTVGSHNLEHTAEITLMLDEGEVTLKKSYHETYKSKRGTGEKVFTGYTIDYFVDDVPVRVYDYTAKIQSLCPVDTAKVLTKPEYFLEEMKVSDRRQVLMNLFGDVPDSEFMSVDLAAVLNGRTVEDYQKIAQASLKKAREQLKEIPARIDEAEAAKPEAGDVGKAASDIDAVSKEKGELEKKLANIDATLGADIRKQLAEAEAEMAQAKAAFASAEAEKLSASGKSKLEALKAIAGKRAQLTDMEASVKANESELTRLHNSRIRLLEEYKETESKEWAGDTVCPTCGQDLPVEKVDESKKAFNRKKSEDLERIKSEGLATKEKIEALTTAKEKLVMDAGNANLELTTLQAGLDELADAEAGHFEDTDEFNMLTQRISDLAIQLTDCEAGAEGQKQAIKAEIQEKDAVLKDLNRILVNAEVAKVQDERIKELEFTQKELAKNAEKLEKGLFLCEEFYRKKAKALTEHINGHFKSLSFRLFKEQVNGGLADDCEALIPCAGVDVPYKSANNASRINAGLELADTLGEAMGVVLPVFIDNAEGVSDIQATKGQQIRLYVSAKDKELRWEV